ncbi:hypothetical protein ACLMJK_007928 [Lecanora helva]
MLLFNYLELLSLTVVAALPSDSSSTDAAKPQPLPITLTNIISIVNDTAKVAREQKLLVDFIQKVNQNEPGVLEFQLNLDKNTSQFLTYEKYKDQKAIDKHLKSSYLADLLAAEDKEKLKRADNQVYFLDLITQFNH